MTAPRPLSRAAVERIYDFFSRRAGAEVNRTGHASDSAALVQVADSGEIDGLVPSPGFRGSSRDSVLSTNRNGDLLRFMFANAVEDPAQQARTWGVRVDAVAVTCASTVVVDPAVLSPADVARFAAAGWPVLPASPATAVAITIHTPAGSHIGVLMTVPGEMGAPHRVGRGPLWQSPAVLERLRLSITGGLPSRRSLRGLRGMQSANSPSTAAFRDWMDRIARPSQR